jgi:hypothetical protein
MITKLLNDKKYVEKILNDKKNVEKKLNDKNNVECEHLTVLNYRSQR